MVLLLERTKYQTNPIRPLWESIGFTIDRQITDPAEAMIIAGANWSVYKSKLISKLTDPVTQEEVEFTDTRRYGVFRSTDNQYLGCIGESFELVQNISGFNSFKPFLANNFAYIESAGTLRHGEIVWLICQMTKDNTMDVVKGDTVEQRVLLTLCHNTNHAPSVILLNTRSCSQTILATAVANNKHRRQLLKMRQTKSIATQLAKVQQEVAFAKSCFEQDVDAYRKLAAKQMTLGQMRSVLEELFAVSLAKVKQLATGETQLRWTLDTFKDTRSILDNLDELEHLQADNIRGTAWALYNALGHFYTYTCIEKRHSRNTPKVEAQLESLWFASQSDLIYKALDLLLNF